MAVALLPSELSGALLAVEVAWGADPTASAAGWTWTDVTTDVRLTSGIDTSNGRGDEASTTQPASCTFTLDNTLASYSLGPTSPNYPNVRQGVPVRVRVRAATAAAWTVVFQGYAADWQPTWNLRGTLAEVKLVAAGALRRLTQGAAPVVSPMRRGITAQAVAVAYWPCEDGQQATSFAPAIGGLPMTWDTTPSLSSNSEFACSAQLPTFNGAVLTGDVPAYIPAADNSVSLRALVRIPAGSDNDGAVLMRLYTTGTVARFDIVYDAAGSGGSLTLNLYDRADTLLYSTGPVGFLMDGKLRRVSLEAYDSAGVVYAGINTLQVGESGYVSIAGATSVVGTVGLARQVMLNPAGVGAAGKLQSTVFGHVSVQPTRSATDPLTTLIAHLNAYVPEFALARLTRLCSENGIPFGNRSFSDPSVSVTDYLGVQRVATAVELLRDVEQLDQGVLMDGVNEGLFYMPRRARESQAAAVTVDAAALQLSAPFDVVADDQRIHNSATVTRVGGGAEATFRDSTGPRGTAKVGLYDTSAQIVAQYDGAAVQFAAWLVALGTVDGYRYPQVTVDLRKNPALAAAWLTVIPGNRIDVTGLSSVLAGHPPETVSLMVEGVTQRFDDSGWVGVAKCSPYLPWTVASYAADLPAGDDAWITRAETDGATVPYAHSAGDLGLYVATTSGPLWSTSSSDYPLYLEVAGRRVRATACSGASSPQVFTTDPLPAAVAVGATVRLWQPATIGL